MFPSPSPESIGEYNGICAAMPGWYKDQGIDGIYSEAQIVLRNLCLEHGLNAKDSDLKRISHELGNSLADFMDAHPVSVESPGSFMNFVAYCNEKINSSFDKLFNLPYKKRGQEEIMNDFAIAMAVTSGLCILMYVVNARLRGGHQISDETTCARLIGMACAASLAFVATIGIAAGTAPSNGVIYNHLKDIETASGIDPYATITLACLSGIVAGGIAGRLLNKTYRTIENAYERRNQELEAVERGDLEMVDFSSSDLGAEVSDNEEEEDEPELEPDLEIAGGGEGAAADLVIQDIEEEKDSDEDDTPRSDPSSRGSRESSTESLLGNPLRNRGRYSNL